MAGDDLVQGVGIRDAGCRVYGEGRRFWGVEFRVRGFRCRGATISQKCEAFPRITPLALKAHRLVYHSTLGSRVIYKKGKKV